MFGEEGSCLVRKGVFCKMFLSKLLKEIKSQGKKTSKYLALG